MHARGIATIWVSYSQIVQATCNNHDAVPDFCCVNANLVLDNFHPFYTAVDVFDDHTQGSQHFVEKLLCEGQFAVPWLLEGLFYQHTFRRMANEA